jgi:hypothetical protein
MGGLWLPNSHADHLEGRKSYLVDGHPTSRPSLGQQWDLRLINDFSPLAPLILDILMHSTYRAQWIKVGKFVDLPELVPIFRNKCSNVHNGSRSYLPGLSVFVIC